jgi:hypothetical protein
MNRTPVTVATGAQVATGGGSVVLQSDGKPVIAVHGTYTILNPDGSSSIGYVSTVLRYNSNGALDTSWAGTGIALNSDVMHGNHVALQSDGKVVVAGFDVSATDVALARYMGDSPLRATSTGPGATASALLNTTALTPILAEVIARWTAMGADRTRLANLQVTIGDLNGPYLGLASGNTITIDRDAAGWGWFVDLTPGSDSEFVVPGNQGEQHHMDLLTAVMHEVGHVLGHDHDAEGLMADTLVAGVRRTATDHNHTASVDQVFGQSSGPRGGAWLGTWLGTWLNEQFTSTDLRARRRR